MSPQTLPEAFAPGSRELAMAGLALVLAGLALTPLCTVLVRRFTPKAQVFFARWRFFHAAVAGLVLWSAAAVAGAAISALPAAIGFPEALVEIGASAVGLGVACGFILVLAARLDPDGIRCLGLRAKGSLRAAAVGVAALALLYPGLVGLEMLWPWLLERLGGEFQEQAIAVGISGLSGTERAAAAVLVIAVLPLFEELCFRGFLQPLLVQNLGDRGGVFLTSLTFAVLHGDSAFLPIFGLALILGSLQLRTQRLAAPFAMHAVHNLIVFLVLAPPTGA